MDSLQPVEWVYLIAAVILLLLSGIFSAAEIGMLSVNRFRVHQLAEGDSPRALLLQRLLQNPARPLTVTLIMITAINYTNETLVTHWLTIVHVPALPEWIPFIALLVLVLLVSEVTPINYAAANPEIVALRTAKLIHVVTAVLRPLVIVFSAIADFLVRFGGIQPRPRPIVTGEEVMTIVDLETQRGVLEEEEKELIHSIFEFSETIVREIMVPRIDMVAVDEETSIASVIDMTIAHRFSRLPVYRRSLDNVAGLVHVKDLLPYELRRETTLPVRTVMRPATFVPESKLVSELLHEMRESKITLAIVLDEYGGTAGLVTVEDLLEEIVGEIYDEYDVAQPAIVWVDLRTLIVEGRVLVDELSDLLDYQFPEGEYDTVGGLLYSRFGDVPLLGEQLDIDGFIFIIEQLDGHRIAKVKIIIPPTEERTIRDTPEDRG